MKKGWAVKKLGDVCNTGAGGTPLKAHKDYYEGGDIPWLLSGEVSQGEIFEAKNFITLKGLNNSSAKLFPPNTVLIAMYGATAGQVGILRFESCTNQAICGILQNDKVLPEYVYYCFLSKKDELISQATGNAQPNISQIKIKETEIPVPQIFEQKQIVSILDEAFAVIDQAKENIQRNLQNAKELFQSKLNNIFSNKGEGWVERKLEDITSKIGSGSTPRGGQESYKETGISLIRSMNVHDEGFKGKNLAFIDDIQANELRNVILEKNDVLLNITGASVARCCIVPENVLPARVNQHVSIIRIKSNIIDSKLLQYALISKEYKDLLLGIGEQGSTRQAITKAQIEGFRISFPKDPKDQQKIIYELDTLSVETKNLETIYEQKLNALEELKKSILQKAFSGELSESRINEINGLHRLKTGSVELIKSKETKEGKLMPIPAPENADKEHPRKVLAGFIIATCCNDDSFGRTKFQKTLHLAEYHCQLDFDTHYQQMRAGPLDEFIYTFIKEGQEKDWLRETDISGHKVYDIGNNMSELAIDFAQYFKPCTAKLRFVLNLLKNKTLREAELMSTVYAVWNNFLIWGKSFTDKELTDGVYDWSEEKEKYTEIEILAVRNTMSIAGLVPVGFGKEIMKVQKIV